MHVHIKPTAPRACASSEETRPASLQVEASSPALHLTTDLTIGISIKSRDSCAKVISPAVLGLLLGLVAVQGLLLGLVSVLGQLLGLVSVQGLLLGLVSVQELLMGHVYMYVQDLTRVSSGPGNKTRIGQRYVNGTCICLGCLIRISAQDLLLGVV